MQAIWNRIETQLQLLAPEIREHLQPGASDATLRQVEAFIPITLCEEVKAVYRIHDGQASHTYLGESTGMVNGWFFFSLKDLCYSWLCAMNDLGLPGSTYNPYFACPTQERYPAYWHPHWLPFMEHWMGPKYCIDFAPGPKGRMGQILLYNDRYKHYPDPIEPAPSIRVIASGIEEFFAALANDLETGIYLFDDATGILWSKEMLFAMRKDDLDNLKQARQKWRRNAFPVRDGPSWDDLNREHPRNSFSGDDDLNWGALNQEHPHWSEELIEFDDFLDPLWHEHPGIWLL